MAKKVDGRKMLFDIAARQRPAAAGEDGKLGRAVLAAKGLINKLGPFVQRTLLNKRTYVAMLQARDALAQAAQPLFRTACREAGELLASADLAGGRWHDVESDADFEVADADVQWQCLVEPVDLEIGGDAERSLEAAARKLCPEAARLELRVNLMDLKQVQALVNDLGAERIARWFKVTAVRRGPDADTVRKLYGRGEKGRTMLAELVRAGAVRINEFPKLIPRTGRTN